MKITSFSLNNFAPEEFFGGAKSVSMNAPKFSNATALWRRSPLSNATRELSPINFNRKHRRKSESQVIKGTQSYAPPCPLPLWEPLHNNLPCVRIQLKYSLRLKVFLDENTLPFTTYSKENGTYHLPHLHNIVLGDTTKYPWFIWIPREVWNFGCVTTMNELKQLKNNKAFKKSG